MPELVTPGNGRSMPAAGRLCPLLTQMAFVQGPEKRLGIAITREIQAQQVAVPCVGPGCQFFIEQDVVTTPEWPTGACKHILEGQLAYQALLEVQEEQAQPLASSEPEAKEGASDVTAQ